MAGTVPRDCVCFSGLRRPDLPVSLFAALPFSREEARQSSRRAGRSARAEVVALQLAAAEAAEDLRVAKLLHSELTTCHVPALARLLRNNGQDCLRRERHLADAHVLDSQYRKIIRADDSKTGTEYLVPFYELSMSTGLAAERTTALEQKQVNAALVCTSRLIPNLESCALEREKRVQQARQKEALRHEKYLLLTFGKSWT